MSHTTTNQPTATRSRSPRLLRTRSQRRRGVSAHTRFVPSCGAAVPVGGRGRRGRRRVDTSASKIATLGYQSPPWIPERQSGISEPPAKRERESPIYLYQSQSRRSWAELRRGPSNSWSRCQSFALSGLSYRALSIAGGSLRASGWISLWLAIRDGRERDDGDDAWMKACEKWH